MIKETLYHGCSGSMSRAIDDGCYLAYVLNELAQKRKIECQKMLISGGDCYPVSMPFDYRLLEHLQTPGSIEGFANTMREHEKDLVRSKLTIFYTDGNITDEHINKTYWHSKGVFTVGLFVGDPTRSESLHRWFDSVLVRHDIESIADGLVRLIKPSGWHERKGPPSCLSRGPNICLRSNNNSNNIRRTERPSSTT